MGWAHQLPSGRWRANYRDGNGRIRSAGTFGHKRAAEKAAILAEGESRQLGWRDPSAAARTWGEWCVEWWPSRNVEKSTLARDESRRDTHLTTRWGDVPLSDITRHDVKAWAMELERGGLSRSTVQRYVSLLSSSLSAAVDAEIIDSNPAGRLRLTGGQQAHERFLTRDEQALLLERMPVGSQSRALVALLLGTGLRWGEAVGLPARRLDVDSGMVRVAEVWDDRNAEVKPYPKGKRIRDVPVPDWTLEAVEPFHRGRKTGFLLAVDDRPIGYHNWRNRVWAPAVAATGLHPLRIHDLRHTYASMLIQAGVSLAEVGRLLGHTSPLTTQRYSHLAPPARQPIVDALQRPVRGADGEQKAATPDSNVLQFRPRRSS